MNAPLYQGTQYTPAHATQASVSPQHPFADNFLKSAAAQTQQTLDLEAAIRDRQEYTLEQNRSAALQAAHQALDNEMIERLSLDDGAEDSFYDDNGILKKDEIESLRSRYLSVADAWTSGFTSEQGRAAATQAQQQYRASVTNAINSKILAGLGNRARRALQNNIKACMARGDYDTPIKLARESNKEGYTSNANLAILEDDINTARWENEIDTANDASVLASAKNMLESTEFFKTPNGAVIANRMQKKIDSLLTYQAKARSVEEEVITSTSAEAEQGQGTDATSGKSSSSGSSKTLKVKPAQAPPASPGYVYRHYAIYGGNLKSIPAQKNAYRVLLREAYSRKGMTGEDALIIQRLGESLELPASTINDIIKERRDSLTAKLAPFNATNAVTALRKNFTTGKALRDARLLETHKNNAGQHAHWTSVYFMHDKLTQDALERAEDDFYAWLPDNRDKNDVQQARAFQQMLNKRMQENQALAQNPAHSWAYLNMDTYFDRYEASENNAAKAAVLDAERADRYKKAIEQDQKLYESLKKNPEIMNSYYRAGRMGAYARKSFIELLAYQARHIKIDSPMDNLAKAAILPKTNEELIIYTPSNIDESSPLARFDSIITQKDGKDLLVKIVKTDAVSAPVPSVAFQDTFKLIGKKDNHFYFSNNVFTFSKKPKVKQAQPLKQNTPNSDDGLTPQEEWEGITEEDVNPYYQEGIFAGVSLDAEDDMPTTPLPF